MTTLQDLLSEQVLPAHCFTPSYYLRPDIHTGIIESRGGARFAAFPEPLLRAIYSGLRYETGQATRVVLLNCGRDWGQEFLKRFEQEMSRYHGQPLKELPIGMVIDALVDLWATYGWGRLRLDFTHADRGVVQVWVVASGFAAAAKASLEGEPVLEPSCYLETGVLASLFSALAGRPLDCVQIQCESMGAEHNHFLISAPDRLKECGDWVRQGLAPEEILSRLLR